VIQGGPPPLLALLYFFSRVLHILLSPFPCMDIPWVLFLCLCFFSQCEYLTPPGPMFPNALSSFQGNSTYEVVICFSAEPPTYYAKRMLSNSHPLYIIPSLFSCFLIKVSVEFLIGLEIALLLSVSGGPSFPLR